MSRAYPEQIRSRPADGHGVGKRDYLVDAAKQIRLALERDVSEDYEAAFNHYKNGVDVLLSGVQVDPNRERREAVKRKITKYLRRAEEIFNCHLQKSLSHGGRPGTGFSSLRFRPIRTLSSAVENLKRWKVLGVIEKVQLVQDPIAGGIFVVKSLPKCHVESQARPTIIPRGVPYMAELLHYYTSEDSIFLHLEHVPGGLLWDHLRSRYPSPRPTAARSPARPDSSSAPGRPGGKGEGRRTLDPSSQARSGRRLPAPAPAAAETPERPDAASGPQGRARTGGPAPAPGPGEGPGRPEAPGVPAGDLRPATPSRTDAAPLGRLSRSAKGLSRAPGPKRGEAAADPSPRPEGAAEVETARSLEGRGRPGPGTGTPGGSPERTREGCRSLLGPGCPPAEGPGPGRSGGAWSVSEDLVRQWAAETLVALEGLHQQGVLCRDLNPRNLLLDAAGHVRLTYFGQWTEVEPRCCSRAAEKLYSAPEVGGIAELTEACDWWSFGSLLYELLTGAALNRYPISSSSSPARLWLGAWTRESGSTLRMPVYLLCSVARLPASRL
ncbi:ribosomal protein S6 kinase-like 1 isoform X2 [Ornithorhynchus anatinus]|uniref:ribosomal protein S6 kinase-like 1 isoform X2 n=1 Tax=Ornithorhynchus anatinus TaxID=9258 RepID=UPI0010A8389D|nr:ribosomal protein S6 kinase-like 1 isoform X2 [Ornithorhynchus anatinus]